MENIIDNFQKFPILKSVNLLKVISFLSKDIKNSIFLKIENLNIIEFLSTYPFLMFNSKDLEYSELLYHGFPKEHIEYQNIHYIYKRNSLNTIRSINYLSCRGLIDEIYFGESKIYKITRLGEEISNQLESDYFKSYKFSISCIFSRIKDKDTLSLKELCENCLKVKEKIRGLKKDVRKR